MLLNPADAEQFFVLYSSLMCYVNERLKIVPNIESPQELRALEPITRLNVRQELVKQPELIDAFVRDKPFGLTDEELEIVGAWRHFVFDRFFIFRYLKNYAIFLKTGNPPRAYGVAALSDPFEALAGPYLPVWVEAMLLPFRGQIVYDGLMSTYNISFGPGVRRNLNEDYKIAKSGEGIITSLPPGQQAPVGQPKSSAAKPRGAPARKASGKSQDAAQVLEFIVGMTDDFCRDHLNDEYADYCRKLAEKLARKRPSPLLSGHPATWACGIVRAIGWVNFLDDPGQTPHMRLIDIDQAFGVGKSTGQNKLGQIRDMFKLHRLDLNWTLPSHAEDNPMIWLLKVNGFMVDIRDCPREAQVVAFEKGLIPYIPADRQAGVASD